MLATEANIQTFASVSAGGDQEESKDMTVAMY